MLNYETNEASSLFGRDCLDDISGVWHPAPALPRSLPRLLRSPCGARTTSLGLAVTSPTTGRGALRRHRRCHCLDYFESFVDGMRGPIDGTRWHSTCSDAQSAAGHRKAAASAAYGVRMNAFIGDSRPRGRSRAEATGSGVDQPHFVQR